MLSSSHVFFYEESEMSGGAGEVFNMMLTNAKYKGNFILKAVEDKFVTHATTEILLAEFGFDSQSMVDYISGVICNE